MRQVSHLVRYSLCYTAATGNAGASEKKKPLFFNALFLRKKFVQLS